MGSVSECIVGFPSKVCVGVKWREAEKKGNWQKWRVSDVNILGSSLHGDGEESAPHGSLWRAASTHRDHGK